MSRRLMFFIRVFLPAALFIALDAWYLKHEDSENTLIRLQSVQDQAVSLGADALTRHLETAHRDLVYLSNHNTLRAAIRSGSPSEVEYLARDFVLFSNATQLYDRIRWIDENGREQLRVDLAGGSARAAPRDKLRSEPASHYFREAMALNPGEVYVSPLDLETEGGKVLEPIKPTLRFATPVADESGRRRGIVMLNYLADEMLNRFTVATSGLAENPMLLNSEGYWLKGSSAAEPEWDFMFNRTESLGTHYRDVWYQVRTTGRGRVLADSGLWTWRTVYPLRVGQFSSSGPTPSFVANAGESRVSHERYVWKVVSRVMPEKLEALRAQATARLSVIAVVVMVILALISWALASALEGQAEVREALERLATIDSLTELANRRHFLEHLGREWSRFRRNPELPAGVVMIDLDHFKSVNDTHGHAAGDAVLQHFARIVRANLRQSDVAGRLGGEEFAVLLPGADVEGLRNFAERVRRQVEQEKAPIGERSLALTVSIGVSSFRPGDPTPEAVLERADKALYRAKGGGRNRVESEELAVAA